MTSIGVAGSTTMESWMVDMLFGQPGQAKAAPPAAASGAVSAVSVASAARSAVAPATGQAVAALQAGGTGAAPDDGSSMKYLTVAQSNAVIASNNAMTSAQISAALYSGDGLQGFEVGKRETMSTDAQLSMDNAQDFLDLANDPVAAAAVGRDPEELRTSAASLIAFNDSMQKAFDDHTLVIQKLSDVPGLNFTQREKFLGPSQDWLAEGMTWTGHYDQQAMHDFMAQFKDGRHAATPFIGGVELLVTWTDEGLK